MLQRWLDRLPIGPGGIPAEALGAPIGPALGGQIAAIDLSTLAPGAEVELPVASLEATPIAGGSTDDTLTWAMRTFSAG